MVPLKVSELWLDFDAISNYEGDHIRAIACGTRRGYRGARSETSATASDSDQVMISLEGYEATLISGSRSNLNEDSNERHLCMTQD